ncbi:hypothetical protein PYCCODRAFT_289078 [Trametes coccinea BRFM310]|uniref:F-box domain-containing protein n=1 Tax=Trametes coccinea (strain BRFM310) TaxID=1353009 RepID=A0A1Y2IPL8_TRAC3|nr:hypothetical protein PYCCODRAFT_289078 [Trametes coccinea BRFM310]
MPLCDRVCVAQRAVSDTYRMCDIVSADRHLQPTMLPIAAGLQRQLSVAATTVAWTVPLYHLPPELIHDILMLLPRSCIFNFGLSCRRNYDLCQPALHHSIVITPRSLYRVYYPRIARYDPFLRWVQELKLEGNGKGPIIDTPGWDFLIDCSILAAFPNVRVVDALSYNRVRGWSELCRVMSALPSMSSFAGSICAYGEYDLDAFSDLLFETLTSLSLSLVPPSKLFYKCWLIPTLPAIFPNLVELSLTFPFLPQNLAPFLSGSRFPALESLTLSSTYLATLHSDYTRLLARFLSRHSATLRDLALPTWTLQEEATAVFSDVNLKLRRLHTCFHMAVIFGQSPTLSSTLQRIQLSDCNNYHPSEPNNKPLWVCSAIRRQDIPGQTRVSLRMPGFVVLVRQICNSSIDRISAFQNIVWNWLELSEIVLPPLLRVGAVGGDNRSFAPIRDAETGMIRLKKTL